MREGFHLIFELLEVGLLFYVIHLRKAAMTSNSSYSVMCYQQYSMEKNKYVPVQGNIIKVDPFGSDELV